jgi:pimeloyl-CoA synthetase
MVTFRVESTSRWDALALASKLARYRWYLVEPDERHWDVCVPVEQRSCKLPEELRRTIETWLRERGLENAVIHAGTEDYVVAR